jgi:hypothetical protein
MPTTRISGTLSGVAGEYLVAGELSRRGYIASITLRNTKGVDILASNATASRTVGIQVKTNQGNQKFWLLNQKAEGYHANNLFYVFVNLNNGGAPDYFIVPSKTVANFAKEYHQKWLKTPGRKGQQHKDNPLREFRDFKKEYLDQWELLEL